MHPQSAAARFVGNAWLTALVAATIALVVLRESFGDMLQQWLGSPTYSHGILVAPIAIWLVWRSRVVSSVETRGSPLPGLILLALALLLWVMGRRARVDVLEQVAAIVALIGALAAMLGDSRARRLAFPLGFLLFMVPFGEELVPALMRITADVAALGVSLLGIPVYRDGMLLSLPGGDFEVVRACSGIRYLITAVVIGTLFAYLTFDSWRRRVAFVALCFVGSVVANCLRALIVILAAHWSDYRIGVGLDHIIFGWIWFGTVMLLLMLLGARFSDRRSAAGVRSPGAIATASPTAAVGPTIAVAAMLAAAAWIDASRVAPPVIASALAVPRGGDGWQLLPSTGDWQDGFRDADRRVGARYRSVSGDVDLIAVQYVQQREAHELADAIHDVFDAGLWSLTERTRRSITLGDGRRIEVTRSLIRAGERRRLVWHWYRQGDISSASRLAFKLRSGLAAMRADPAPARAVMLSAEIRLTAEEADQLLGGYLVTYFDALERCAGDTGGDRELCLDSPGATGGLR